MLLTILLTRKIKVINNQIVKNIRALNFKVFLIKLTNIDALKKTQLIDN
jgi:hypothetical protein